MNPLMAFLLGAVISPVALATAHRFYAIHSNRPASSRKLAESIRSIIDWLMPPEGTHIETAVTDVPSELFDDFRANAWPWQQPELKKLWAAYRQASSREDKAAALRELFAIVEKYS
jgi:hypothetical protein